MVLVNKYDHFHDAMSMEDYFVFNKNVLEECLRISDLIFYNVQFLTGNKIALFKLIGAFADNLKEIIIWDKIIAEPAVHAGVLNSQFEVILVFDKKNAISREFKECNFNRGTLSNIWNISKNMKKGIKSYRAVYPIELMDKIITNFSKENDLILDPFVGTGTTCISALVNQRRYLGIEISPEYCDIANKRIDEYKKQINIFEYLPINQTVTKENQLTIF